MRKSSGSTSKSRPGRRTPSSARRAPYAAKRPSSIARAGRHSARPAPTRERSGAARSRRASRPGAPQRATRQVLLDGLSTHRLARRGPPEGLQEDPGRARRGGADVPAVAAAGRLLRPRAAVARRRGPCAHRGGARGRTGAARGEPGAGAAVGAVRAAVPDLLGRMGRERRHSPSDLLLPKSLRFML